MAESCNSNRIPFFDNAKAILMLLVVLGHFAECGIEESRALKAFFIFVYAFHMPAFFFISGVFAKLKSLSARAAIQKAISYIAIGFMLEIELCITSALLNETILSFSLLSDGNVPWFMFSLAAFQILAWVFKASNPATVLVCSVCLSLFVGYDESIGDFLYLSRTIVFFPFFWLGSMFTPADIGRFRKKRIVVWGGALVIAAFAILCIFKLGDVYSYRGLFTGRNPYSQVAIPQCGWTNRLVAYGVSCLVGLSFLSLVPRGAFKPLSWLGKATIQMYFWHMPILYLLLSTNVLPAMIDASVPGWWIIWLVIGFLTAVISSAKLLRQALGPLLNLAKAR